MDHNRIIGFAIGPIASALIGLVMVPMIAWNFNPEDVGRVNIFQVAVSLFLLLTVLGLDQAYVREYHEENNKQQLLLASFIPGFLLLIFIGIPTGFYARELSLFLYQSKDPVLYWITLGVFFISYIARFLSLILRMQERGWAYSASQVFPKLIQLLLLGVLVYTTEPKEFIHVQLIMVGAMFSVMVLLSWHARNELMGALKQKINPTQVKKLLHFGTPLIFSGLAFWALTATSTVALRSLSTLEELAIYSVANSFAAVGIVFQSIFTVLWAPTIYKWFSQGADMVIVDKITMQALAVVCAIFAVSGMFSWVVDYFLPAHYISVKYILLCMLMQPLLYTLSEITCVGIAIKRKTIFTIYIVTLAVLSNWVLCYLLVPLYGAGGAAIANAVAFYVFFIGRTEVSARVWRNFNRIKLYAVSFIVILLSVTINLVDFKNFLIVPLVSVLMLVLSYFLLINQWGELFNNIRNLYVKKI
jgi:O-antigen/teichoic acid export membrane protein